MDKDDIKWELEILKCPQLQLNTSKLFFFHQLTALWVNSKLWQRYAGFIRQVFINTLYKGESISP